ncbi:hypothetical protein NHX12_008173 [Muraenolepis orangiensis]|uniref:Uncharacterized protein n=1 Tax=Muraenolepis orangiensis TaxID=630683 RepID=A0A9Q0DKR9_9TELE|nr:hypothetical protein NHX12_008173 [Muraenolepis orangiensis]
MTAFFRGKWGIKSSQETPAIPTAVKGKSIQDDEDDEDDNPSSGFKKDTALRNSRFYRSMRKKRQTSSEQSK